MHREAALQPYIQGASKYKIEVGVIFLYLLFSVLVMSWSRYELIVKKQWKRKSDAKKIFLSVAFYKGSNISWCQLQSQYL